MDSVDFVKAVFWTLDRDASDATLARALQWVAAHSEPERVFEARRLALWATMHGYVSAGDNTELMAVLKACRTHVPPHLTLAGRINDLIHKMGGWTV